MKDFLITIVYPFRVLSWRSAPPLELKRPEENFWNWVVISLLAYAGAGVIYYHGSSLTFNINAIPLLAAIIFGISIASFLSGLCLRADKMATFKLASVFMAIHSLVMLAEAALWVTLQKVMPQVLEVLIDWRWWVYLIEGLVVTRAFLSIQPISGQWQQMRILLSALVCLGVSYYVPHQYGVPYPVVEEFPNTLNPVKTDEELFILQQGLVDKAVEKLKPSRKGKVDFYSVIFAGDDSQDVFLKEAVKAQSVFDEHLGTKGRSSLLVNNYSTFHSIPIASMSNLRLMLTGMAEKIQPDEDVVILYLTSHGSADARITAQMGDATLLPVQAEKIAEILNSIGFRWKVVIVSACYSGSFIPHFSGKGDLIITAASAKTVSFGCSSTADLTYFGQAFLDDSLPQAKNFISAYEQSRVWIDAREKSQKLPPSLPQMRVGKAIEPYLARHNPFDADKK